MLKRLAIGLALLAVPALAHAQEYDVLLRGGRVLDGSGNPWYYADVAINGDRIAAVGNLTQARARRVVDVRGLYVAPGFIDVHSHASGGLSSRELSGARPLLAQGITTAVINPDGGGAVDLVRQREALLVDGLGVNVVQMVPHGSIRSQVIGSADRAPTAAELERMRGLVRAGMEAGAFGLSSGPYYAPGSFASTDELIELAKVAAQYGGVYSSHIRDEADYTIGVVAAVDEVIRIAREAQLPGIVSHMKALGPRVWGYSGALVKRIERARDEGVQVFGDQYPYDASSTGLSAALLPRWAQAGGGDSLQARLNDPATRARIRAEMVENLDRRGGADRIQFTGGANRAGRTLAALAAEQNRDPIDVALELFSTGGGGSIVSFNMHDDDIALLMRQPWMMTSSDGGLSAMGSGVPHPRQYGTYPRKLRKYVVEERVVDLAFAIRSMTSLPATVFSISDRGVLRAGAPADIVVFDLARVRDTATYAEPHQLAEGMVHVLVNGGFAVAGGTFAPALHGRVLSRR
ncbi:MAG TPA: amidohydrolase family protein [Longimicrobiales bacterium]|nr:amidohydrolase family protein [Longimicrobiales bacterium]